MSKVFSKPLRSPIRARLLTRAVPAMLLIALTSLSETQAQPTLNKRAPSESQAALQVTVRADRQHAFVNEQILVTREVTSPDFVFNITGPDLQVNGADVISVHASEFREPGALGIMRTQRTVYALFARAPGVVTIAEQPFLANLPSHMARQFSGSAAPGQDTIPQVKASASKISLKISAAPADSQGRVWLTAEELLISSQWADATQPMTVGEPKSRQIMIRATGQQAAAIVPVVQSASPGAQNFRLYSGPTSLQDAISAQGILGQRVESAVILPVKAGPLTLPAVSVSWFNTRTRQWQRSDLPAERVQVLPSPNHVAGDTGNTWLVMMLAAVSASLALACLALLRANYRLRRPDRTTARPTERRAWQALNAAIKRDQPGEARQCLLAWARAKWPQENIRRLEQIAAKAADSELPVLLTALDASIFSDAHGTHMAGAIKLAPLIPALKSLRRGAPEHRPKPRGSTELEPLYPNPPPPL